MKYKVVKYNQGGKTPQEIMAEARRNQAIEQTAQRQTQTDLDVATANIIPTRTQATVTTGNRAPISNQYNAVIPTQGTFSQEFAKARKAGLKEFV